MNKRQKQQEQLCISKTPIAGDYILHRNQKILSRVTDEEIHRGLFHTYVKRYLGGTCKGCAGEGKFMCNMLPMCTDSMPGSDSFIWVRVKWRRIYKETNSSIVFFTKKDLDLWKKEQEEWAW